MQPKTNGARNNMILHNQFLDKINAHVLKMPMIIIKIIHVNVMRDIRQIHKIQHVFEIPIVEIMKNLMNKVNVNVPKDM